MSDSVEQSRNRSCPRTDQHEADMDRLEFHDGVEIDFACAGLVAAAASRIEGQITVCVYCAKPLQAWRVGTSSRVWLRFESVPVLGR